MRADKGYTVDNRQFELSRENLFELTNIRILERNL